MLPSSGFFKIQPRNTGNCFSHACQVAVHLGMMDDARKLYAASERYDLLCRLYQVSVPLLLPGSLFSLRTYHLSQTVNQCGVGLINSVLSFF